MSICIDLTLFLPLARIVVTLYPATNGGGVELVDTKDSKTDEDDFPKD